MREKWEQLACVSNQCTAPPGFASYLLRCRKYTFSSNSDVESRLGIPMVGTLYAKAALTVHEWLLNDMELKKKYHVCCMSAIVKKVRKLLLLCVQECAPNSLSECMRTLFNEQETGRYRLRQQHCIERVSNNSITLVITIFIQINARCIYFLANLGECTV